MKGTITISGMIKSFVSKNFLNILFISLVLYFVLYGSVMGSNDVSVVFMDIGQGDAILLQQGDYQILVDGGPDDSVIYKLAKYMPWFDKTIEVVVLTHPHADHIDGLMSVLEEYNVEKIFYNPVDYDNEAYNYMLKNYSDLLVEVNAGDYIKYGDIYGVVLYPFEDDVEQDSNINNESVVMMFYINNYKVLLMGDAEQEVEAELVAFNVLSDTYILKVGHHCSRTSSSEMFLDTVSPDIAICSCSRKNSYGHPDRGTLEKLVERDVQYLLTYEEGDIVINF